jgi:hypothetical protein
VCSDHVVTETPRLPPSPTSQRRGAFAFPATASSLQSCADAGDGGVVLRVTSSQGSRFLGLPLMLFNCFDPEKRGQVNLYQLFIMLALFCMGSPETKTMFW